MPSSKLASFFTALFFGWGILFGLFALGEYFSAASIKGLGVGTSTAVSMTIQMWVGGCAFFGIASLICRIPNGTTAAAQTPLDVPPLQSEAPPSNEPVPGDKSHAKPRETKDYKGCRYAVHGDDMVVASIDGKPMTWRNEAAFTAWIDSHPSFQ